MQTFATCSFLHSSPSFTVQDRDREALFGTFYLKRLRFRCALSQNKSLALKVKRLLCYCGIAVLQMLRCCTISCKHSSQDLVSFQCERCFCHKKYLQYVKKKKKKKKGRVMVCHCFASQVLVYSCHSYLKCVYI